MMTDNHEWLQRTIYLVLWWIMMAHGQDEKTCIDYYGQRSDVIQIQCFWPLIMNETKEKLFYVYCKMNNDG